MDDEFFKVLGIELLPWQREVMERIEAVPADSRVITWPGRGWRLPHVQTTAITIEGNGIAVTLVPPCPPHQWAHAPTCGYFTCFKCHEHVNYDDPRYAKLLGETKCAA